MGSARPCDDDRRADDDALPSSGFADDDESASSSLEASSTTPRDEDHGSVALLHAYGGDRLKSPDGVEAIFRELRKRPECVSEFDLEGPRTNAWRMGARLCCVNTPIYNDPGLSKSTCIRLMQRLLGEEYCPAETTLKKCRDGFWIVAVALSVLLRRLVTPYRAAACFRRFRNQKYAMTDYGFELLRRHGARWPPYPEAVSSPSSSSSTTTTATTHHNNAVVLVATAGAPSAAQVPAPSMMNNGPPATVSQTTMQSLLLEMMQQEPANGIGRETIQDHSQIVSPSLELLMGVDLDVQQVELLELGSAMLASSKATHDALKGEGNSSVNGAASVLNSVTKAAEQALNGAAVTDAVVNDSVFSSCDTKAAGSDAISSPAGTSTDMQRAASLCMLDLLLGPASQDLQMSGLEPPLLPSLSLSRPGSGTLAFLAV